MINKYPYTDMHELNADWLLSKTAELEGKVKDLEDAPKGVTSVTPYYHSGTKIADYEQDGAKGEIYIPNNPAVLEKSAINRFDDGIDSYFKKVVSSIVAVQAGTGTPSPSNPRAISGFTSCTVTDNGKNLLNNTAVTTTHNNVTFTVNNDKTVVVNTSPSASALTQLTLSNITLKKNVTYKLSGCPIGGGGASYSMYVVGVAGIFPQAVDTGSGVTFTPAVDVTTDIKIIVYNGAAIINKTFYPMLRIASDTDDTYAPYVAQNTTIQFGAAGTVYGGTVDIISGILTVTKGYISSYNGEILPGAWISNIDVYTGTNQPTTGAQVVYELAIPLTYQLTPAQLRSLVGVNNLSSSTGEVTGVDYITNETIAWLLDLIVQ